MIGGRSDLVAVEYDAEEQREEWVASRCAGLGGSDMAAVVGEHPNKAPIDVFLEKTTGVSTFVGSERTDMGNVLEPIVLDFFAKGGRLWPRAGGPYVVAKPPSVCHRDRPWQRGSADAFVFLPEAVEHVELANEMHGWARDLDGLLALKPHALGEVKTHGWYGSGGYNLDDTGNPLLSVPHDKRIQCAWYMALYDVDLTYLICLVDTHLRRTFVIHRDREVESMLLETGHAFWHDHVLTGLPPAPDGTDSYRQYLGAKFRTNTAELVASTTEVEKAAQALLAVKREQKKLEKERELSEQVIKRHIGEAAGVRTALGTITWKSQASGKLRDKEARLKLYEVAGWTDDEIAEFEERYKQPDHRVLRTPK